MAARIVKGKDVQSAILSALKEDCETLIKVSGKVPGIAFVAFSEGNPLAIHNLQFHSQIARKVGYQVDAVLLDESTTPLKAKHMLQNLNHQHDIDAILLLQPVPPQFNPLELVTEINPRKEIEGFHPRHLMDMLMKPPEDLFYPMSLPTALHLMLDEAKIDVKKDDEWVFVVDRYFFENPLTNLVSRLASVRTAPYDCPVTIIESTSNKLKTTCQRADLLFVISRQIHFIRPEWIQPGACIIDIYNNYAGDKVSVVDPQKTIPIIKGGVDPEAVKHVAGTIMPVPGGIMPVVLALSMRNVLIAFKERVHQHTFHLHA